MRTVRLMLIPTLLMLFIMFPLWVNAADVPSGPLKAIGTYPVQGEKFTGRLVIYFDETLEPLKDLAGNTLPVLTLDPHVDGQTEISGNYISFVPMPNQTISELVYAATVHETLKSVSGRTIDPQNRIFAFTTGPNKVTRVQALETGPKGTPILINFAASMNLADLQKQIVVTDKAQQPATVTISQGGLNNQYCMMLPPAIALPVQVIIPSGVKDSRGQLQLLEEYRFLYPSEQPLQVMSAGWNSRRIGQQIIVCFNSTVSSDALSKCLKVLRPNVNQDVMFQLPSKGSLQEHVIQLSDPLPADETLRITVAEGLHDDGTRVLPATFSQDLQEQTIFETQDQQNTPLAIDYDYWRHEGIDGPILNLSFNASVLANAVQEHLHVEPAVSNLKVESSYHRAVLVKGDWKSGEKYTLTLTPGLSDTEGRCTVTSAMTFSPKKVPTVRGTDFGYGGKIYFPRRTAGQMTVKARNYPEASVSLHWLFPNNIAQAVTMSQDNGVAWGDFTERLARFINSQKITFPDSKDKTVSVPLNVSELLPPDKKGVFTLSLEGHVKVVVWTDLGVIGHWQDDEVAVFVHNLFTLTPVANAKVTVYTHKNQIMGMAVTDLEGIAHLTNLDKGLGRPLVAVVETDTDATFLELQATTDDPTGFTDSMPTYKMDGYDAYVYTDRNLYRPGETVHARWIGRTRYGDALPNVPLQVKLINPKSVTMLTKTTVLSALGTGGDDFTTRQSYLTGKYELQLLTPGSNVPLATSTFNIEEFVPQQIKTEVNTGAGPWLPNTAHAINVSAQHLFGTPASNRTCEAAVILRKGEFKSDQWKEFRFTNDTEYMTEVKPLGEQQTDVSGHASFSFTYQPSKKATFPLRATIRGEVKEAGGRGVANTTEVLVLPSEVLLGVNAVARADTKKVIISAAAIKPDASPAALTSVKIILEREVWNYYVRRYSDYNEPNWTKSFEPVETRDVPMQDGRGGTEFDLPESYSYYRVRVSSQETPQFSAINFYAYWNRIEIVESARPSLIKLALNKERYSFGEEAELRIESPFDGKGVVVLQGERIQQMHTVEVKDGVGIIKLALTKDQYPNVWAEVTVVHQVQTERKGTYPYSSFAMINIPLEDPQRQVAVSYPGLPEEVKPAQHVQVAIETKDSAGNPMAAEVTLAAVDEGIHAILDYKNPDPCHWFQRTRRADYARAEYYDRVAYDFTPTPIGGDAIAQRLGKNTPTIGENWIKPVALWTGVVQTDASGKGMVTLDVPEFDGQLRLVAVAVSSNATGATSAKLFVRRPYILRASMPRFVLPGDTFKCFVSVFNTSQTPIKAKVLWTPTGALKAGAGAKELNVAAGSDVRLTADFTAPAEMGQGGIAWDVDVLGADGAPLEHLHKEAPIPVRPPTTYEQRRSITVLQAGETKAFVNAEFLEDAKLETAINVGANPFLRLRKPLDFLVHYPYGCVEQTTSSIMPLYVLRKNAFLLSDKFKDTKELDNYVCAGVSRLFSMQTASGGLAGWPGGGSPYAYGSVYACHFLTLLHREHEMNIPEDPYQALRKYVRSVAEGFAQDSSYSDLYLRAYAYYVLALEDDLKALEQIARFDAIKMPRAGRYLLAAALALNTQDPQRVSAYLASAPYEPYNDRETWHTLNSEIRNTAVELIAMMQINGAAADLPEKANVLIQYLEKDRYTTQESAFVMSALGLYLSKLNENTDQAAATITGPEGSKTIKGAELFDHKATGPGIQYTVSNTGSAPMYVNLTRGGIPLQSGLKTESQGMTIGRTFRDNTGAIFTGTVFPHGESYVVDLTISCDQDTKNVIVADLLPAGFEVENPRLDANVLAAQGKGDVVAEGTPPAQREESEEDNEYEYGRDHPRQSKATAGAVTPEYLELRDDRLLAAFMELPKGAHHYYYVVRAVTPGTFQYPGVHAECMYDPMIHASSAAGAIEIKTNNQ